MNVPLPKILRVSACATTLALSIVSAFADYSSTLLGLNPLGYWRLNEPTQPIVPTYSMANSSAAGAALNGLYYGVPTLQAPGAVAGNTAASFSGTLQYAEVPYSASLNPASTLTVEFWAYLTNVSAGAKSGVVSRYIPITGGPAGQRGYLFFVNNGNTKWQFRVYNGTAGVTVTDVNGPDIAADTWYHVVGVYDGTQAHIYVNGVESSPATTGGYVANTNAPLRIGAGTSETAPSLFFPGTLDEVAVYNTVLTPSEIAAHYDAASTNAAGYAAQIGANNPAGYWRLSEGALPPYVPYAATNSGSLGSAQDGAYSLQGATSGVAGPLRGQFAGFAADNKSVAFNGTSGQITIPGFATVTDTATITGWIKRDGTVVNASPILLQRATGSPASGLVVDFTHRLGYVWNDDAGTYNFNPGADFFIPDGVWTFAALTVTPTNATIYIGSTNGLKSATRTAAHGTHDFSGGPLAIGRDTGSTTRYIKGNLDDVAIFDQALDPASISNLFYSATPAIPLVTRTPADPLYEGITVTFTAYGLANGPVNYQWRKGGANLSGQTSPTLVLANVNTGSSGNYDVVVTSGANSVTSSVSAITVSAGPPVVFANPVSITRYAGLSASFTALAGGSAPLTYQWQKNSNDIAGATSATLSLTGISAADAASYRAKLVNPYGTNFTANATLTVLAEANSFPALAISDGPAAYWRLNETSGTTAFDYAGGYNGTTIGAVTLGSVGPRPPGQNGFESGNNAFTFNGTTTWVEAPSLNFNTNTMTFAAWIKVNAYHPTDLAGIVFSRGSAGASGLHMISTGELRYHWETGGHYGFASGLTPPLGQWVFVALVIEPSRATIYMNDGSGLVSAVNTATHNVIPGSDPMYLGRDRTDRVFNGDIDEALVFKRSLSLAEIQNLSLTGNSGPTPPSIVTQPVSRTVIAGQSVSFTVGALGAVPMTFQWQHAGTNLPGANGKTLTIPSTYYTDAGTYRAAVTNSLGGTNSQTATLTVEAPSSFANVTNNLVLHLRFDGNYADSSGRTNHAQPINAPVFVAGKIGSQAVQVNTDPTNALFNYVQLWDTNANTPFPDLSFTATDSFSVAFWVKYSNVEGDLPIIGNVINSTYNRGWVFAENFGSRLVWTAHGDVGAVDADGVGPVIKDGTWHHVVATFDRALSTAVTYIDGAQVDVRSIEGLGSLDQGNAVCLGQDPTGGYGVFGTYAIDDVGIWRQALTPGQATGIYAAGQVAQSFDVNGPASLTLKKSGSNLELIWQQGTLQSVDNLGDTWVNVAGAVAPYHVVTPSTARKFYRVKF